MRNDEESALRQLLRGEATEASAELVSGLLLPRLAAYLRRRHPALAAEDADDLAREALAIALERRGRFDAGRNVAATTWLYGIAKLRAAEYLRRHGRDGRLAEEWIGDDDEDPGARRRHSAAVRRATSRLFPPRPIDPELTKAIKRAIANLPEQQRRAAAAHYLDELQPRDIDAEYGWRPNTANVYLSHARRAMRKQLGAYGPVAMATSHAHVGLCLRRRLLRLGYTSSVTLALAA